MKIENVRIDEARVAQLMKFFSGALKAQQQPFQPGTPMIRAVIVEQLIAILAVGEDTLRRLPPEVEGPVRDEVKKILELIESGKITPPDEVKAPSPIIMPGRN